jgi:hypothetical protein
MNLKRAKRMLWLFGLFKIPMIGFCRPRIESLDENHIRISIPTNFLTRNHLKSMYFGALAVGADLAAGFHVFMLAEELKLKASFAFKSFQAEFLYRPEGRVYFESQSGAVVRRMLETSAKSGERINEKIPVTAWTENKNGKTEVAQFVLECSVKVK